MPRTLRIPNLVTRKEIAVFRFVAFLVLGSAFVTLFSTIVQTHRLWAEPKVLSFADRWNGLKPMR